MTLSSAAALIETFQERWTSHPLPAGVPNDLDPLPVVFAPEDTELLEEGARQWGRLLTAVYRDLWGPQMLVARGLVPPGELWGEAGFDPAFHAVLPAAVSPLSLLRLDVVRSPLGWRLVSLGTGSPRGLGAVLETRITHGRIFGAEVPHPHLRRLAPFFQSLKDQWFAASLTHKDDPVVMVWTDGPEDPDYAEPVYLARYFGYPLVESRDLTVRSGKVLLKTLGGLKPVDVLVRMVGDRNLDSLVGNPLGAGGVAGLVQTVRDGSLFLANAPGAGLLAEPTLVSRYPALCQALLGEALLIPPGTAASALPQPFLTSGQWQERPVQYQFFTALTGREWTLLPGGLARDPRGNRKDLWFLSSHEVEPISLLPTGERPIEVPRAADLPSRLADDLFWLGRYTERAWVDLRMLERAKDLRWNPLDELIHRVGLVPWDTSPTDIPWTQTRLAANLSHVQRISGHLLDRMSMETHRVLQDLSNSETFDILNLRLAAFHGLTLESMTRSPGWLFLEMGRRLERAQLVVSTVGITLTLPQGEEFLSLLLDVFDSTLTYRTRYRLAPQRGPVLDLLLLDEMNPRSLAFQIEALKGHIRQLPRDGVRPHRSPEERLVLDLSSRIRLTDGGNLVPGVLEPFLEASMAGLNQLAQTLTLAYLAKIETTGAVQARGSAGTP